MYGPGLSLGLGLGLGLGICLGLGLGLGLGLSLGLGLVLEIIGLSHKDIMKIIKPPTKILPEDLENITIFLGGSIEMGRAENWQEKITKEFQDTDLTILNPRRDDWDSTWIQSPNNPVFAEQVNWELDAQDFSDINVYYFADETMSPITLLELGTFGKLNNCIVYCTPKFWRWGNVSIFCSRMGIPMFEDYDKFLHALKSLIFETERYYNS